MGLGLPMQEALGRTKADKKFVYLSDDGHFENLGLYEMVRRQCRTIVVSDAGADPDCKLEDLGNALRKIKIDLGIDIEFDRIGTQKRTTELALHGVHCAIGRITYPEPDSPTGDILYIKAGLYSDVPVDVRSYAAADARFPHDTTLNQWFRESQFDSYRALGSHIVRIIGQERAATSRGLGKAGLRLPNLTAFVHPACIYLSEQLKADNATLPVRLVS